MVTRAIVAKLVATDDMADEVADFLAGALPLAEAEEQTVQWYALRTDETTFWIVDAFPDQAGLDAHLDGDIAAALMEHADRLLAEAPKIMPADVLAAKLPG